MRLRAALLMTSCIDSMTGEREREGGGEEEEKRMRRGEEGGGG